MRNHLKLLNGPIVTLRLDSFELHVHRNLLCKASPVFEAAFTGGASFVETKTQTFDFDSSEVSIKSLGHLVQWLYSDDHRLIQEASLINIHDWYTELADLYVFAEKYVIVDLKNSIIEEIWKALVVAGDVIPGPTHIRRIYDNTPDSSPCRRLLAAVYGWSMDTTWPEEAEAFEHLRCHADFGAKVAIELGKRLIGDNENPLEGEASDFYETPTAEKR
ncbi:MAG: hypothetical protein Q9195_003139 [Heterodermia aff. obscurata]